MPQTVLDEINGEEIIAQFSELEHEVHRIDYEESDVPSLDPGETAAIILATETGAILLTDDLAARDVANDAGIEVHGSIGIVLYAHADGQLSSDEARELIRLLKRDTSLYLADPLVEYALQRLESDYPNWG